MTINATPIRIAHTERYTVKGNNHSRMKAIREQTLGRRWL